MADREEPLPDPTRAALDTIASDNGVNGSASVLGILSPSAQPISPYTLQTTRPYQASYFAGTLGIVPRRGWDARTRNFMETVRASPVAGLTTWAQEAPLRLLAALADIHPMVGMARRNNLTLPFGVGDTTFIAEDSKGDTSDEGTDALNALWKDGLGDFNGLVGLQKAIAEQVMFYGLACTEGVPSKNDKEGIHRVVTFDPLSVRYRDTPLGERLMEQYQTGRSWVGLSQIQCIVQAYEGNTENPYGRPLFSAALGEALSDIQGNRDLSDVLHTIAWPRLTVGFPFEAIMKFAIDNPQVLVGRGNGGADLTAEQYAGQQFVALAAKLSGMKADDTFVYPVGGQVGMLNGATGMTSLRDILEFKRHRLVQALDQLPTLLGIQSGGTLAYSSSEWGIQAKKFEELRDFVNSVIIRLGNLHLRLLGMPLTVKAKTIPIRATDAKVEEEARKIRIENEQKLVELGYQSREEASINLTGSGPAVAEVTVAGDSPQDTGAKANAAGQLIRAGFDAEKSLEAAGLPPIPHSGLLPITLKDANGE